jgi:hypothetical protein
MKTKNLMRGLLAAILLSPMPALAEEMSNAELIQELQAMKARVEKLEAQLAQTPEAPAQKGEHQGESPMGVNDDDDRTRRLLDERISQVEEQLKEKPLLGKWAERVTLSGLIEVEASYENLDSEDPETDGDSSDLTLATVELGVDVDIAKHVSGHVLFLWEEDDTDPVEVDEGFITLDGEDAVPLYLNVGKIYVPFGYYESHFISDPITLELGETNESALKGGFVYQGLELSVAAFNGDVDETGEDDHIESYVASVAYTLPEETVPDLGLMLGVSYISNIADSDGLAGETPGEIADYVGGLGAFVSVSFRDRFFFEAEYIGATDRFEAGELSFDDGQALEPKAWNFEFAFVPVDRLEVAVRYEGGDDLGGFQPEEQYGVVASYGLFENTALSLEYLHGEFENDDERDLVTAQLGIEF